MLWCEHDTATTPVTVRPLLQDWRIISPALKPVHVDSCHQKHSLKLWHSLKYIQSHLGIVLDINQILPIWLVFNEVCMTITESNLIKIMRFILQGVLKFSIQSSIQCMLVSTAQTHKYVCQLSFTGTYFFWGQSSFQLFAILSPGWGHAAQRMGKEP